MAYEIGNIATDNIKTDKTTPTDNFITIEVNIVCFLSMVW